MIEEPPSVLTFDCDDWPASHVTSYDFRTPGVGPAPVRTCPRQSRQSIRSPAAECCATWKSFLIFGLALRKISFGRKFREGTPSFVFANFSSYDTIIICDRVLRNRK
ncbi:hypothetical protein EUGRSUZ_I00541 [Eucalyptus grandis]|uniref:Uncharacterized protein n=2 Tax=Eucalyptus grandis TaxID=71139 RepID=A0ACC3JDJ6_EUCGR|nr:hypothetical protein EUGRSUZ_I00541 [Eucalyptus grandis]